VCFDFFETGFYPSVKSQEVPLRVLVTGGAGFHRFPMFAKKNGPATAIRFVAADSFQSGASSQT